MPPNAVGYNRRDERRHFRAQPVRAMELAELGGGAVAARLPRHSRPARRRAGRQGRAAAGGGGSDLESTAAGAVRAGAAAALDPLPRRRRAPVAVAGVDRQRGGGDERTRGAWLAGGRARAGDDAGAVARAAGGGARADAARLGATRDLAP